MQHLNRKHFSLDQFQHFAFRVKYSSGGKKGFWTPVKRIICWKHLFWVSKCVAASGGQEQMFFFLCVYCLLFTRKKSPGWGVFSLKHPVFVWMVWCTCRKATCGLWVTVLKEIALGGFSVFFFLMQYITNVSKHIFPPFSANFIYIAMTFLFFCPATQWLSFALLLLD